MEDIESQAPVPAPSVSDVPAVPTVKTMSGFDEGEVLPSGEIVRGTYEGDELVGWHKELPASGGNE